MEQEEEYEEEEDNGDSTELNAKLRAAKRKGTSKEDVKLLRNYYKHSHIFQKSKHLGSFCGRCKKPFNETDFVVHSPLNIDGRCLCLQCYDFMHI